MVKPNRKWTLREIFNALLYVLKNGCVWADIPPEYPLAGTVYYYFKIWRDNGLLEYLSQEMGGDYRE